MLSFGARAAAGDVQPGQQCYVVQGQTYQPRNSSAESIGPASMNDVGMVSVFENRARHHETPSREIDRLFEQM
jgi:hypothetical protein